MIVERLVILCQDNFCVSSKHGYGAYCSAIRLQQNFKNMYFIHQFFKILDVDEFVSSLSLGTQTANAVNAASFLTTSLMVIPVSPTFFQPATLYFLV